MNWETVLEKKHGIEVKLSREQKPYLVAIFDDGERVTEPVAAMQSEEVSWEAAGYAEAKEKYSSNIHYEQETEE